MQLRILGCHGGETPKHRTSSFLVGDEVAIDAGAITSSLSLGEQERIRSVLVSHPHMDHIRDLATLADKDLRELPGTPLPLNVEQRQTGALARQPGAATHRADDQIRQGDARV